MVMIMEAIVINAAHIGIELHLSVTRFAALPSFLPFFLPSFSSPHALTRPPFLIPPSPSPFPPLLPLPLPFPLSLFHPPSSIPLFHPPPLSLSPTPRDLASDLNNTTNNHKLPLGTDTI